MILKNDEVKSTEPHAVLRVTELKIEKKLLTNKKLVKNEEEKKLKKLKRARFGFNSILTRSFVKFTLNLLKISHFSTQQTVTPFSSPNRSHLQNL
jgi:hypothetical protein